MNSLRWQGFAFSFLALLVSLASLVLVNWEPERAWPFLAAAIIFLGVPHGALDTVFAQRLHAVQRPRDWLVFSLFYVTLAVAFVLIWYLFPLVFLTSFLLISLFHFSGDPAEGTPLISRVLYGGAIFTLPALLHREELTRYFSMLLTAPDAQQMAQFLHGLSYAWLGALLLASALAAFSDRLRALEFFSLTVLAVFAPPLLAFTVYFCAMHSSRHILRTLQFAAGERAARVLLSAVLPMIGFLVFFAAALYYFGDSPIEQRSIQLVFVSLAALTLPHMALVERVRLAGWKVQLSR